MSVLSRCLARANRDALGSSNASRRTNGLIWALRRRLAEPSPAHRFRHGTVLGHAISLLRPGASFPKLPVPEEGA